MQGAVLALIGIGVLLNAIVTNAPAGPAGFQLITTLGLIATGATSASIGRLLHIACRNSMRVMEQVTLQGWR